MVTLIYASIVLGVLIFIHELGHFLVAKKIGVGVLKFSLGFGPKIFGKKIGETEYIVSAFPLGGYLKMIGEGENEEVKEEDIPRSFTHQGVSKKMAIVAAGPISNLIFAVLVLSIAFTYGIPALTTKIGEVKEGFPAWKAGIRNGDKIIGINGKEISSWEDLSKIISEGKGKNISLKVDRQGLIFSVEVVPVIAKKKNIFGEDIKTYQIGILQSGDFIIKRYNPAVAIIKGFNQTWIITKLTAISIIKLIQGVIPLNSIGGPILIAQQAGQQGKAGFLNLTFFIALISINLGILNLLPIPILDGGYLLFFSIESIMGKPLSMKKKELAQQIGLSILILLMGLAFYNDIMRFWNDIVRLLQNISSVF